MATVRVDGTFDLVLLAYNTLAFLTEQEQQVACLRNAAAHLSDHGGVLVDLYDPTEFHSRTDQKVSVVPLRPDEALIVTSVTMRPQQLILLNQTLHGPDGVRNLQEVHRYCWPAELDLMAQLAGLRLGGRWADWSKAPVRADSPRHLSWYTAER